jgi:hypothetical protein
MLRKLALVVLLTAPTFACGDSLVFLGKGISNTFLSRTDCPNQQLCMDSLYLWTFRVDKVLAGPRQSRSVRAIAYQHTDVTPDFIRSVELFVLEPIQDQALRSTYGANYTLVFLSPREKRDRYCLSQQPQALHLNVPLNHITIDDDKLFCFPRSDVLQ